MTKEAIEKTKVDQRESQVDLKNEEGYREHLCPDLYKGKECFFKVQAKTDDEVIGHARMHQKIAHGVKEISPDLEKKIEESIRPVPADGHHL